VLASASPRRAELLSRAGLRFTVLPVDVDETPRPGEDPVALAERLALAKAEAAARRKGGALVLTADTVVWVDRASAALGKPRSVAEARATLLRLTGAPPHHVTTAWVLRDGRVASAVDVKGSETARVWMRALLPGELDAYLDSDEWRDKAGGYGIQGIAGSWVTRVEGSYSAIVGLPVAQITAAIAVRAATEFA
jgi:septum formation protein